MGGGPIATIMKRREFLSWGGKALLGLSLLRAGLGEAQTNQRSGSLRLFLAGDLMTGRGIDQVLARSVDPVLHEPYVKDARRYVELAETENGEITEPVPYDYPWGDALGVLESTGPDFRIVNLETSVTTSDDWWRGKGIHYRMHPENIALLTVAGLHACTLGNNHVLDWGHGGLRETLETLEGAGIAAPGAGRDLDESEEPAVLETASSRLLLFSYGTPSSGVTLDWRATAKDPGVNVLSGLGSTRASLVIEQVERHRLTGDKVIVSIHWGGNWGYEVPEEQREFAHRLIDAGATDLIHGHSSHHPKAIEVYRGRPIMYGAGDLLNDYEGISGREEFRSELVLMYFPELDAAGALTSLEMAPMRIRRFRLEQASNEETRWLTRRLDRECRRFGGRVESTAGGRMALRWE
jgi:poly-gamma-glutamate capsule biosynthesis protein CapA/YwtB (metallophosphatase superfamily)